MDFAVVLLLRCLHVFFFFFLVISLFSDLLIANQKKIVLMFTIDVLRDIQGYDVAIGCRYHVDADVLTLSFELFQLSLGQENTHRKKIPSTFSSEKCFLYLKMHSRFLFIG